jgi:hypothetical protein
MPPWFRGLIVALIYFNATNAVIAFYQIDYPPIPGIYYFLKPEKPFKHTPKGPFDDDGDFCDDNFCWWDNG